MLQSSSPSGKDAETPEPEEETDAVEDAWEADALWLQLPAFPAPHPLELLELAPVGLLLLLLLAPVAHEDFWKNSAAEELAWETERVLVVVELLGEYAQVVVGLAVVDGAALAVVEDCADEQTPGSEPSTNCNSWSVIPAQTFSAEISCPSKT